MSDLPPLQAPRPNAGQGIDWDKPVGYSHAGNMNFTLAPPIGG